MRNFKTVACIHGSKVMLCIKKRDKRMDGRTNNPEAICTSNFFEVGGIIKDWLAELVVVKPKTHIFTSFRSWFVYVEVLQPSQPNGVGQFT